MQDKNRHPEWGALYLWFAAGQYRIEQECRTTNSRPDLPPDITRLAAAAVIVAAVVVPAAVAAAAEGAAAATAAVAEDQQQDNDPPPVVVQAAADTVVIAHKITSDSFR